MKTLEEILIFLLGVVSTVAIYSLFLLHQQYSVEVYSVSSENPPQIVKISDNRLGAHAIAYVTSDGYLWTVRHSIHQSQVYVQNNGGGKWISVDGFYCRDWETSYASKPEIKDGTCRSINPLTDQDLELLENENTLSVVRVNARDYEFDQVAVWNPLDSFWMFFEIVNREGEYYDAQGLPLDVDLDGELDGFGLICSGFSGSPVFIAQDGQIVVSNLGSLVSIGEVRSSYEDPLMFQHRKSCGKKMSFSISYFE